MTFIPPNPLAGMLPADNITLPTTGTNINGQVTLTDAIRRVRSLVNEPAQPTLAGPASSIPTATARYYTDTEIRDWINDGLRDVSRRAEDLLTFNCQLFIPGYMIAPGTSGVPKFPLPLDVVRINRIEFVPWQTTNQIYKLEPSTQNEMDQIWGTYQQNQSTYPRWWVTWGYPGGTGENAFLLQIYPQSSQPGNLNLFYYRLPCRINDPAQDPAAYNQVLDIPNGWDDMVVDYAVYQALMKAKDSTWQSKQQSYESKLAQMIDVTRKYHDQQSYVSYGTNYLPEWLTGGGEW